jgi:polyferredoxin
MSTSENQPGALPRAHTKKTEVSKLRRIFLWIFILAAFALGLRHAIPGEGSLGGAFDSFCPFGAVETFYAYITTGKTLRTTSLLNFAIFSGVLTTAVVGGRAFCGWICPLGGVQDMLAGWARRLTGEGKRHIRGKKSKAILPLQMPAWLDKPLRYVKYLVLALILWTSITAIFPPLHAFCPALAVFSLKLTPLLWLVLVGFVASSVLFERFSCKYICPLGALLAITNKFSFFKLRVNKEQCNQCGRCQQECPMGIDPVTAERDLECIRCLECMDTCSKPEGIELRVL